MNLRLNCDFRGLDNVRFSRRAIGGLVVGVTRTNEDSNILLSDKDVERLYGYLGEYLGKDKESVLEVSTKSVEEAMELIEMSFNCTFDPTDTLTTRLNYEDEEVYIKVNAYYNSSVYLSSEDALTLANNIIKAFGGRQ